MCALGAMKDNDPTNQWKNKIKNSFSIMLCNKSNYVNTTLNKVLGLKK